LIGLLKFVFVIMLLPFSLSEEPLRGWVGDNAAAALIGC
jgi:hypothetical protein